MHVNYCGLWGFFWSPESPWSYIVTICFPPSSCMMCVLEKHLILFIFFFKIIWPNLTSFGLWYGVRGPYLSWVFMKFMNPTPAGDLNFRWKLKKSVVLLAFVQPNSIQNVFDYHLKLCEFLVIIRMYIDYYRQMPFGLGVFLIHQSNQCICKIDVFVLREIWIDI